MSQGIGTPLQEGDPLRQELLGGVLTQLRIKGAGEFYTGNLARTITDAAQTLGAPEFITDPNYATAPARSKNRDALNAAITKLTETKSTETWVNELNAAGVPCGPIYAIDQMFEDAQVKHLGIAQDVPNAENRHIRLVGQPFTLSRTPSKMAARPPEFGEQTDEVLAEFGFGAGEIAELRQGKVV